MRTSRSMHKFQYQIDQAEERISEVEDQLNKIEKKPRLEKKTQTGMNKVSKTVGLHEET